MSCNQLEDKTCADCAALTKKNKLLLVLDLDNTLVETVSSEQGLRFSQANPQIDSWFWLDLENIGLLYVKLRPYAQEFLHRLSELYHIVLYTMGSRAYASGVLSILDRKGQYVKEIIAQEDHRRLNGRTIFKRLHGCQCRHRYVVMVDDQPVVWQDRRNLLNIPSYSPVARYLYFEDLHQQQQQQQDTAESKKLQPPIGKFYDKDNYLDVFGGLLILISRTFYQYYPSASNATVRDVMCIIRDTLSLDKDKYKVI